MTDACEVCAGRCALVNVGDGQLLRCTECGHILRDLALCPPRRSDAWGGSGVGERVRGDLTYRRIRALTRGTRVRRVLDVGCGDGALLRRFYDDGMEVVGCDPGMLGRPLDPVLSEAGALHACTLDELANIDGIDGIGIDEFDLVLAVHVIEHLPTAVPAWRSLLSRVRRGGHVYAITPAADSDQLKTFGSAWWMLDDPTHVRFYSADSLGRAAIAGGAAAAVVARPRDDSLMCEAMSAGNRARDRGWGRGASAVALASAGPLALRRAVSTRWSPVIDILATAGP